MHPIAEKLLQQHIEFELEALTGSDLKAALRTEVQRVFDLAEELTLSDCATERRCIAAFKRLAVKAKIPPSAGRLGVSLFLAFAQRLENSGVDLQAVISRDRFVELVELAASLNEPRRRLFAQLFSHPFYGELVSSLVYEALLNYLIEDNLISQRVPGVGSMLKLGRKMATRAVPGLDATVERQLKRYIRGYLPSLIHTSEQFVERSLTDEALREHVADSWPSIAAGKLSGLFEGVTPEDASRIGEWSLGAWDELRQSEEFTAMGETLIAHVFERYGGEPLSKLLGDLGVSQTLVRKELLAFAPPLMKQLRKSGLLADLLRSRLTPFYESQAVARTLGAR